jgi:hypothetical protein
MNSYGIVSNHFVVVDKVAKLKTELHANA